MGRRRLAGIIAWRYGYTAEAGAVHTVPDSFRPCGPGHIVRGSTVRGGREILVRFAVTAGLAGLTFETLTIVGEINHVVVRL